MQGAIKAYTDSLIGEDIAELQDDLGKVKKDGKAYKLIRGEIDSLRADAGQRYAKSIERAAQKAITQAMGSKPRRVKRAEVGATTAEQAKVLKALPKSGKGKTSGQLAEETGLDSAIVSAAIKELKSKDKVKKASGAGRGTAYIEG